jgi:hypothetical protein
MLRLPLSVRNRRAGAPAEVQGLYKFGTVIIRQ